MKQQLLFNTPKVDMLKFEQQSYSLAFKLIAGIDEAGRGPLAGPVVAAAVILPYGLRIDGVNDSKKLSHATRELLFEAITKQAVAVAVGISSPELIDSINILQATRSAMLEAVTKLAPQPDYLLIDGITAIDSNIQQKSIIKGDSLSFSIAAASIIAKVTRDRIMCEADKIYPDYGFAKHKGYATAAHMTTISKLGPTPIHRRTFAGVKEYL